MFEHDMDSKTNHLSIEEIERQFGDHEPDYTSRRDLIVKGIRIFGGIMFGGYILSRAMASSASVKWMDEKDEEQSENVSFEPVKGKSRIVHLENPESVNSTGEGKDGPVHDMIMKGIIQLTGETDKARAWRKIAQNGQRVGIKTSCIAGRNLSTQVPVVMAIVEGLKLAGILERDIIIWERSDHELKRAGYTLQKGTDSLRCFGTPSYNSETNNINGTKFRLSSILTDEIDVLINVPILKNHGSAGITLSLKNHYGSHNNPGDHHGNNCDPHIANICAHKDIKSKTKLVVVDALRAQCNGGPGDKPRWKWNPGIILMGYDPVAIDRVGGDIIDERRREVNVRPLGDSHRHIITAANLGLGNESRDKIDIQKIVVN